MIQAEEFSETEKNRIRDNADNVKNRFLGNLRTFKTAPDIPLLLVGDVYNGIWLEHNQDNLFLAEYAPESAWASQKFFMDHQREDGLIMFAAPYEKSSHHKDDFLYWHIQCVYSFARCALEIADRTGRPEADYDAIYRSGSRYDDWFTTYRNRLGTGLAEMYCEWDTGHDNDPRVTDGGIPHTCPGQDAVNMPELPIMPILSVDLSAMLYGNRCALAELAERLGKPDEAASWREKAFRLKQAIRKWLYDPEDDFYYDRDRNGFRKYRTEHITRLFLNRVLDQNEFDSIYARYFETEGQEFLPPFPFPAVSVSDPHFDRNCPKNSWASNSQATTTERAILWMDHYNRGKDLTGLLSRWMRSFLRDDNRFQQEINPFTGAPDGSSENYSPSLIL